MIYTRDSGWEHDGRIYAYDQASLYYSAVETIHIGGREYSPGHLYLQLGDRGTVLDLGASGPDFDIVLDGTWAVSAAFYSGESASVTETELSPWGWSMMLVGLAFLGFLAVATVLANHLNAGGLRPMDWLIIGISGIVVVLMVAGTAGHGKVDIPNSDRTSTGICLPCLSGRSAQLRPSFLFSSA